MLLKKISSIALSLFVTATMIASEGGIISNANKNDVRYITNTKRLPDAAYQLELRNRDNWKNFTDANGIWYVIFNEENAKPHRAFGKPITVFGMNAENKAMNFITTKLNGFNIPVADLQYVNTSTSENFQYVHYYQKYQGLKVLTSDLFVKMTPVGQVITFGCDVFNDITISTSPTISAAAAIQAAQAGLNETIINTTINNQLFILPVPEFKQNKYKLVYEIMVETVDNTNVPAKYKTLVDAETGTVVSRTNKVLHFTPTPTPPAATDVTITGTVYPTHPYDPSAVQPLRNLKMVESATTYNTDASGYVGLTNTASTTATFTLEGLWSKVVTNSATPSYTATLNPGTNALTFDANANIRELSAYYHVNIIHDYMKTKFPAFTDMDNPLITNVDVAGTCNAFYNGVSINFYAVGGGCNSLAQVGDVVYHEYGHGINDKFYQDQGGSFDNGAMGEGYADIWALGVTANPVLGIGMDDVDPTVFVRRYDIDKKVYPQDLVGEVHADGEIIAGAWWDTGVNFGNLQQMMDLYKETFFALVSGPDGAEGQVYVDVLIEALTGDDVPTNGGDNDITNGTPNDNAIVDAFEEHGITLLSNAVVTHTPVESSLANQGIAINANITVTYPWAMAAAKAFYKINRTGAWTGVAMSNTSGTAYSGTIPAQPQGTVIGYYIGLEGANGNLSAVQPMAANLANPNIPHFILCGVNLMSQEDFDDNLGNWTLGLPSDDATSGVWIADVPIGSFATAGDPSTMVQPDFQHTVGGQFCAVTGNAPSETSGLGTNDVDGGETTLGSPVYNLSTYTNPIFTYYRWYINNPPTGANPANDYWEVQISNDGTNWVKVERTNVSDKSWRRFAFRVKDYVTLSSTVQVRFVAEDSVITGANLNGGSLVEAAIDDFYLYEEATVGVAENDVVAAVNVFPNPANNFVTVSYDLIKNETITIEMYDQLLQLVYTSSSNGNNIGNHTLKIFTNELAMGLYTLNVKSANYNFVRKVSIIK